MKAVIKFGKRSVESNIYEFFVANPHEELSIDDMATKFNCSPRSVIRAIRHIRTAGVKLEKVPVYRMVAGGAENAKLT